MEKDNKTSPQSEQDKNQLGNNDLERYLRLSRVGNGTYGDVYQARDIKTNETVALKKIKLKLACIAAKKHKFQSPPQTQIFLSEQIETDGIPSTALREISLLMEIDHPNVLSLKDVVIANNKLYLIFEYLDQDLKKFFQKNKDQPISPELIKSFMHQLLKGILACHKRRVLHRDLKPQNLLLSKDNLLKIGDFGLARAFSVPVRQYTHEVITLWYRAIQILLGAEEYSTPVDIWSAGCIFAELYLKKPLFSGDSQIDQIYRIFRTLGTPTQEIWPGVTRMREFRPATFPKWAKKDLCQIIPQLKHDPLALDLMENMLVFDPVNRISAKNALFHPYFNSLE